MRYNPVTDKNVRLVGFNDRRGGLYLYEKDSGCSIRLLSPQVEHSGGVPFLGKHGDLVCVPLSHLSSSFLTQLLLNKNCFPSLRDAITEELQKIDQQTTNLDAPSDV